MKVLQLFFSGAIACGRLRATDGRPRVASGNDARSNPRSRTSTAIRSSSAPRRWKTSAPRAKRRDRSSRAPGRARASRSRTRAETLLKELDDEERLLARATGEASSRSCPTRSRGRPRLRPDGRRRPAWRSSRTPSAYVEAMRKWMRTRWEGQRFPSFVIPDMDLKLDEIGPGFHDRGHPRRHDGHARRQLGLGHALGRRNPHLEERKPTASRSRSRGGTRPGSPRSESWTGKSVEEASRSSTRTSGRSTTPARA